MWVLTDKGLVNLTLATYVGIYEHADEPKQYSVRAWCDDDDFAEIQGKTSKEDALKTVNRLAILMSAVVPVYTLGSRVRQITGDDRLAASRIGMPSTTWDQSKGGAS